jgi:DNA-binding response OmpR family regulator
MSKKVLIVEDEITLADAYKMILEDALYEVRVAHDGSEAVDCLKILPQM